MQSAAGTTVRKSAKRPSTPAFGRGTGVPDPIDIHVGSRIRTRRIYLDMRQEELGRKLGLTFQQVQKYESGANRVSASRLWEIAAIVKMPIGYFFPTDQGQHRPNEQLQRPESIELIRFFYAIPNAGVRQQFFDMMKTASAPPDRPGR